MALPILDAKRYVVCLDCDSCVNCGTNPITDHIREPPQTDSWNVCAFCPFCHMKKDHFQVPFLGNDCEPCPSRPYSPEREEDEVTKAKEIDVDDVEGVISMKKRLLKVQTLVIFGGDLKTWMMWQVWEGKMLAKTMRCGPIFLLCEIPPDVR